MKKGVFFLILMTFYGIGCTKKEEGLRPTTEVQTIFNGDLRLNGADLSKLKNIETIDGSLILSDEAIVNFQHVNNGPPLVDISALKNVKRITGNLIFGNLSKLKTLEALGNLEKLEGTLMFNGNSIPDIENWGFTKLTKFKTLRLMTTNSVLSFKGFGNNTVIEQLTINGGSLKQIKDLESISEIKNLTIEHCASLESIGDMSNIHISQSLNISNASKLTKIGRLKSAAPQVKAVVISLGITDLDFLSNITQFGQLAIHNCQNLNAVGLENCTKIQHFSFQNNPFVKSLQGLETCEKGVIILTDNKRLENIDALKNMKKSSGIHIENNPSLKSIEALSSLGSDNSFATYVNIIDNVNLTALCPISKLVKNSIKARETNKYIQEPIIKGNAVNMSLEDMMRDCQ